MPGVPAQAVYVLALRKVMKDRFGKNLIAIEAGGARFGIQGF